MRLLRLLAATLFHQSVSASICVICGQFRIPLRFAALGVSPLPLWGQHHTQVANVQPLATIRIFPHFSIDIHAYDLYNCPRMVRNEWKVAERRNAGCPLMAALPWVLHTDCLPSGLSIVPSAVSPVKLEGPAKEGGFAEEGGQVRSRQDQEGYAVLRPLQFLLSAFCFPNFVFPEPSIRAVLSYFELF